MAGLTIFLPKTILTLIKDGVEFSQKEGVVLFCDVAGFTPLTETLSKIGKEGSERLTLILNTYFTQMIDIINSYGGDVLRFGGDSMTIFFDKDLVEESLLCSIKMMEKMKEFKEVDEGGQKFSLSMKIGVSRGVVVFGLVGEKENYFDYYCAGYPLDESADAEHRAQKGEIVLYKEMAKKFKNRVEFKEGGFGKLVSTNKINRAPHISTISISDERLSKLLPKYLLERAGEGIVGEHRSTSVIFLGFKGISLAKNKSDVSQFHQKIKLLYNFFCDICRIYGGTVNKIDMGDKGMKAIFLFGSPFSIENKEEMAIRCALELKEKNPFYKEVFFKMGVTTSHLFTGAVGSSTRREFTAMGDGINVSARLMQKAEWNQIICDLSTYQFSKNEILFKELGETELKGKEGKFKIFEPLKISREEIVIKREFLVEREEILRDIKDYILKGGMARLIVGEMGFGKTAIIEFIKKEVEALNLPVTRVFLANYHKTKTYSLFRGALRSLLKISKEDDITKIKYLRDKVFPKEEKEYAPLLNPILGIKEEEREIYKNLSPKDRKDLTFAMVERLFSRCEERFLLADNIENCDPLSIELLNFLLTGGNIKNMKFILTTKNQEGEINRILNHFKILKLKPLSEDGVKRILFEKFFIKNVSIKGIQFFYDKSKGNPKLLNSLIEMAFDLNIIKKEGKFFYFDEDRLFKTTFPTKLEDFYLKKVDTLSHLEKEVAQIASVLGYSVSFNLLLEVTKREKDEIGEKIKSLENKRILIKDSWGIREYYKFSDPFLRDAIYESSPFLLKRDIHLKCALFLEKEEGDNPKLWQILSNHFKGANEVEKYEYYLKKCAFDAISRFDNVSALRLLEEICEKGITSDNLDCAFSLFRVYGVLGKLQESLNLLKKIEKQKDQFTTPQKIDFLLYKTKMAVLDGNFEKAEELFCEIEEIAKSANDINSLCEIYVNKAGGFYGPQGELQKAMEFLEKCLILPETRKNIVFKITALFNKGVILKQMGKSEEALNCFLKAYRRASRLRLLPQMANIAGNVALLYYKKGVYKYALKWAKNAKKSSEIFGLRQVLLSIEHLIALIENTFGKSENAKERLLKNIERSLTLKNRYIYSLSSQALIDVCSVLNENSNAINYGENCLTSFIQINDVITFKESMVEFFKLFYSFGEKSIIKSKLRENYLNFLQKCGKNPTIDGLIDVFLQYFNGKEIRFDNEIYSKIDEKLKNDYLFLFFEEYSKKGERNELEEILLKIVDLNGENLTKILKIKVFLFLSLIEDKRAERYEKEVANILKKNPYGIYGLRALAILWDKEKVRFRKKIIRKLFLSRLYYLKVNSPDWVFNNILKYEEIKKIFLGL